MSAWIEASLQDAVSALIRSGEKEIAAALGRLLYEPEVRALQLYRAPEVGTLADEIFDCDSLEMLYGLLPWICSTFGVSHCTIHCIRERGTTVFGTKVLTTYPDAWVTEYVKRRYSAIDPVMARCQQGSGSFFWDELVVASPIAGHFLRSALEHGVGPAGVTFVADNAQGDTVAISLASTLEPEEFRRTFRSQLSDFHDVATLLVDVFSDLSCEQARTDFMPTDDQLKVLRALVGGMSPDEIKNFHFTYGSYPTVEKSILKCFSAKTLFQAAALAVKKGLLEALPYFEEDVFAMRNSMLFSVAPGAAASAA